MDAPVRASSKRKGFDRVVNHFGYVEIRKPGHYGKGLAGGKVWFLEHRYLMEIYLGRPLCEDENVHHVNGDKTDNRLENLELWTKRQQPSGQRVTDLLDWAYALRERYKNDRNKVLGTQIAMALEDNGQ
ncbi:MAG: HNH endonuclease [Chloroflexota bacterium]|nr:HNH endonuclease [Chloroflexota bacterium]